MKVPREGDDTRCDRCAEKFDPASGITSEEPILTITFGENMPDDWPAVGEAS